MTDLEKDVNVGDEILTLHRARVTKVGGIAGIKCITLSWIGNVSGAVIGSGDIAKIVRRAPVETSAEKIAKLEKQCADLNAEVERLRKYKAQWDRKS